MNRHDQERAIMVEIQSAIEREGGRDEKLSAVCGIVQERIPRCDWVGFYLVDVESPDELILGPFVGEATEHVRIPLGKGICGQAAKRGETIVVPDVSKANSYLSCSARVRSEIVIPIFVGKKIVGELDIDSHTADAFSEESRKLLERICRVVSALFD